MDRKGEGVKIPVWLRDYLKKQGISGGSYVFGRLVAGKSEVERVVLANLPKGFIGIAINTENNGLVVEKGNEKIIYEYRDGKVTPYAVDLKELLVEMHRDEVWEELDENMPIGKGCFMGIVVKTKTDNGTLLTLGFDADGKKTALVIKGEIVTDEMLADALNRELKETLMITEYKVINVIDDGGWVENKNGAVLPIFTVVVEVEDFDLREMMLQHPSIGWVKC